jgi:tetratricopeptide (TPR) repeat protein
MALNGKRSRGPGVDIDPEAIRRARLAAGLSLSDVAGDDLSRAAVHRVETGRARPSMRTLELIAHRTGTPLETFLSPVAVRPPADAMSEALELARLERLSVEHRHAEVIAAVNQLLPNTAAGPSLARIQALAGASHYHLAEPAAALVHLRQARSAFEAAGDPWMAVECMGWEAAALSMEEDQAAVEVGFEALRRCRELDPVPPLTESRILGHLAGIYLSRHEWEHAIAAYRGAIEAAGPVRDLAAQIKMNDGLSIAYQGLGELGIAVTYAQRAAALTTLASDRLALARIENNLGVLLLRNQRWDEAEEHLRRSLDHCADGGLEQGKSHVLLSLGQLASAQGEQATAELYVQQAIALAREIGEHMTEALGQQWLGRITAAMGRSDDSDRAFTTALTLLEALHVPRRLAECHRAFAEVLQQRDDLRRAVLHWQRAAELWQPPVDAVGAAHWIDSVTLAT